jgi:hypothetical protein
MTTTYYDKYLYYRQKYIDIKQLELQEGGKDTKNNKDTKDNKNNRKYDFLIYHSITPPGITKLMSMLDDGYIKKGKFVKDSYRVLGGTNAMEHIFANIYFPDIKNFSPWVLYGLDGKNHGIGLLLHPDLIYDKGVIFNKGWLYGPYEQKNKGFTINKSDDYKTKRKKLMKIKKWIQDPYDLPKLIKSKGNEKYTHELVFNENIPIKYIIGILCNDHDIKKIKNKVKKLKLNIQVYADNKMELSDYIF